VDFVIRSLDGQSEMPTGEQGMIFVAGPSIFSGYLDTGIESPFETIDGKKWYKTGDLGYVDDEDFLFITGRLKRFVKIAGEMVSLPFVEGILLQKYGNPEVTTLAVEAREENGNVTIVAFVTFEVEVEELNDYIHANGASNLVKFARVERLEAIPVLGTGKTDYKALKGRV
jgi:long-chain-fatty-acid--[acyl-carrier-protein] ligase